MQQPFSDTLYPPPPPVYKRFTQRNLELLEDLLEAEHTRPDGAGWVGNSNSKDWTDPPWKRLKDFWMKLEPPARLERQAEVLRTALKGKARADPGEGDSASLQDGAELGADDAKLPDFDLQLELLRPRLDWIEEDAGYFCFSDHWPVKDKLAPLSSHPGLLQLYPDGAIDRKATLLSLLRSLLFTYFKLTGALQAPPRDYIATIPDPSIPPQSYAHLPPEQHPPGIQVWKNEAADLSEFIRMISINMQHLLNEMRPAQAADELRGMMRDQLDRRRKETTLIRERCAQMKESIAAIRQSMQETLPADTPHGSS